MFIARFLTIVFALAIAVITALMPESAYSAGMYFKAKPLAQQQEARERNRLFLEGFQRWQQQKKHQEP